MEKIGKVMGIIVLMLIAFFSASLITMVHATETTQNVTINNTTIVNDGSGSCNEL